MDFLTKEKESYYKFCIENKLAISDLFETAAIGDILVEEENKVIYPNMITWSDSFLPFYELQNLQYDNTVERITDDIEINERFSLVPSLNQIFEFAKENLDFHAFLMEFTNIILNNKNISMEEIALNLILASENSVDFIEDETVVIEE